MSSSEKYPPAPHPRHVSGGFDLPDLKDNPLINDLKKDLKGIQKDIDLNYRRLNYDNEEVNILLEKIAGSLGSFVDMIEHIQNNS